SYRHLGQVPAATRDRIRSLIERDLTDASDAVRAAAAESLLWWGDPRDCRALVECLRSPSHQVRAAATSALEGLVKRVPVAVEEALGEADLDGPGGADIAHVLSRLDSPRAEELLKRGLHSSDPRTRRAAVQALSIANASEIAQLIGYAVADEDIDVQVAAVRTLGQMRTKEADVPLRTALDSPFAPTRAEAALALGRRDANGAIPRIRDLLEDREPIVVSAALDALAWLGDSEVATAVERALSHADDEIYQAGLRAARTLPVGDAERLVAHGLAHSAWNVRMLAINLLVDLDTEHTRKLLQDALTDETDSMVRHAIETGLRLGV
ncbi:MAG: HEAT repeat domain-containing protein, partial [Deltaproteobacteria bacterium]|nr:HEAT repeat domain-containing protein [Deltaproteobacteria bacterium]